MSTEIPSDLLLFVRRMVASKRYLNEGEVLAKGLRLLHAREMRSPKTGRHLIFGHRTWYSLDD